jgi:DNA-binding transcriptional MerR regulator
MLIEKNDLEEWMKRIMERFDRLEAKVDRMETTEKTACTIDGEKLLDNQDLCFMLNCSKRTLQRYRVSGLLPCKRIRQKTYYLETDVMNFIRKHLQKPKNKN